MKINIRLLLPALIIFIFSGKTVKADEPDFAYIFSYTVEPAWERGGLQFAWSIDRDNWHPVGPDFRFLLSDFGTWGSQKKFYTPFLIQNKEGLWHCIWNLGKDIKSFAHAASEDLYTWQRQSYPRVMENGNCLLPEVSFSSEQNKYIITWISEADNEKQVFKTTTTDFKNYTPTEKAANDDRLNARCTVNIEGTAIDGTVHRVSWETIDGLIKWNDWMAHHNAERAETMDEDPRRFKNLESVDAEITLYPEKAKTISDLLVGIFFEDINYAADGGIYAELVQNRGFEYALSDRKYRDSTWNSYKAWSLKGKNATFTIDTAFPIHYNNKHYAVLDINQAGAALVNEGFSGIPVKGGEKYIFSVFARSPDGSSGKILIRLVDKGGKAIGETEIRKIGEDWKKFKAEFTALETVEDASIEVIPQFRGKIALDMISLFPEKTFRGHENGLRADLAQSIADIHPKFVRFPGGCVAHGDGLENMYRWKNTVGPLEARKPQRNIWNYHQSAGLGYYEYFRFCEDIGAEPVPVVPAGVPCQNSSTGGHGQQGGIPMSMMDDYVQEVLDLIEWANGDKNTKWGRVRAEAGHPEPFRLKYLGVGNEDLITDIFEERFTMIYNAVKEKHPEITVIGTVGPFYMGTDYDEGWEIATRLALPMVDEHYYQPPGWFIHNQDFYDRYDRSKSKVYLGEYAAHVRGRHNNIETALSEALYMTSLERNGDVVAMASYAPLLAKEGYTQWNPDLIYFNNTEVKPTVGYYVQQMYGQNSGDEYIPSLVSLSNNRGSVKKRVGISFVKNNNTNDLIVKLVNLLPVEVNAAIDLSGYGIAGQNARLTVLTGSPDDRNAKPQRKNIEVVENFDYQLPAYSFSLISIKME